MTVHSQYKVIRISEGGCGTIVLGGASLPLRKIEETLNAELANGWEVVFMVTERARLLLFWSRESMVVTLGRK